MARGDTMRLLGAAEGVGDVVRVVGFEGEGVLVQSLASPAPVFSALRAQLRPFNDRAHRPPAA